MSYTSSQFGYSPYNAQILTSNSSSGQASSGTQRSSLSPGSTASNSSHPANNESSSRLSSGSPGPESSSHPPSSSGAMVLSVSSPVSSPSSSSHAQSTSEGGTSDPAAARLAALNLATAGGHAAAAAAAAAAAMGPVYSASSYPSTDQNPYPSIAVDNAYFGSLGSPYAIKEGATAAEMNAAAAAAWSAGALPPTACYYSYDHPTLAAYGYGGGYDLAARRKNATRESTATLKAWLNEHKKNPYPTKGEKIMLAIITKMTLTQVSTWFANARRRLKKENKMTWEPKNKLDDEDVDISDDEDKDRDEDKAEEDKLTHLDRSDSLLHDDKSSGIPIPPSKPKIWSLADTAVCKTPPPPSVGQGHLMGWPGAGIYRPNAMSAFRSNMLGIPRHDFFSPGAVQLSSAGSNELPADTPPHTPPNAIKNGLLGAHFGYNSSFNQHPGPSPGSSNNGVSQISPNLDYGR